MVQNSNEIEECIRVLEALVSDPARLAAVDRETRNRLVIAAGRLSRPTREWRRGAARALSQRTKREQRAADEATLLRTGIRQKRLAPVFVTPEPLALAASEGGVSEGRSQPRVSGGAPGADEADA